MARQVAIASGWCNRYDSWMDLKIVGGGIAGDAVHWRSHDGIACVTVVCRVTFDLVDGELPVAQIAERPSPRDRHHDNDARASLYAPCDLLPFKSTPELLLVGKAFSARGPVRSLIARIATSEIDKRIEVVADRWCAQDGEIIEGERFKDMPLRWENAAGGADSPNPVGRGDGSPPDRLGRRALPNLQPPGASEPITPVSFGPLAPSWPQRSALGGESLARWNEQPLSPRLDRALFNAAPLDQRLARIDSDQRLLLENLHRRHAQLVCRLPGVAPRAFVETGAAVRPVELVADTLWIDTDRAICTLTWRGTIPVDNEARRSRVCVALERAGHPLGWNDIAALIKADRSARDAVSGTLQLDADDVPSARSDAPLPFGEMTMLAGTPHAASVPSAPPPPAHSPWARQTAAVATIVPGVSATRAFMALDAAPPIMIQPAPALPNVPAIVPTAFAAPPFAVPGERMAVAAPDPINEALRQSAAQAPPVATAEKSSPRAAEPRFREIVELLWHDPGEAAAIGAAWPDLTAPKREDEDRDDEDDDDDDDSDEPLDFERPAPKRTSEPAPAGDDERAVAIVLGSAAPTHAADLGDAMAQSVDETGRFRPPIVLVSGLMTLPLEPIERLRAIVAASKPLAGGNKKLQERMALSEQLIDTAWVQNSDLADSLARDLLDAMKQGEARLNALDLEVQVERSLLEKRAHQKRSLMGAEWLRALLVPYDARKDAPGGDALVVYLPLALSERLPIIRTLSVRIVVEAHFRQDEREKTECALKALALARVCRLAP